MTDPTPSSASSERAAFVDSGDGVPPRRRRGLSLLAVVVVVLAGAGAYVERTNPAGISLSHPLGWRRHVASGTQDNNAVASTAQVSQRSLSQTTTVAGRLGYAGDYTVVDQLHGTITALPEPGAVIGQGQVIYRVDGYPVVLLSGSAPAYRTLAKGASAAYGRGTDVAELNHDLVALGYVRMSDVDSAWDEFGWATKAGIEELQEHLRVDQTGTLSLGQVVFLPTATRVISISATLGGPAGGPVLTASSMTRQVTVNLDAGMQSQIRHGDTVTIALPDNSTTPGVVSWVGTVATTPASGSGEPNTAATIPVRITPTSPADTGLLDQTPVQVAITTATVNNALVVPVNALLAMAGGGYAVEVIGAGGTHQLVSVSLGLFDDAAGLVQVSGSGLAAGEHVVVPAS